MQDGRNRRFRPSFGIGSSGGTRTPDPAVNSRLLYQLSYRGSARRDQYSAPQEKFQQKMLFSGAGSGAANRSRKRRHVFDRDLDEPWRVGRIDGVKPVVAGREPHVRSLFAQSEASDRLHFHPRIARRGRDRAAKPRPAAPTARRGYRVRSAIVHADGQAGNSGRVRRKRTKNGLHSAAVAVVRNFPARHSFQKLAQWERYSSMHQSIRS